jgi:thiol:disulfide interchange protein DsbD
LLVTAAQGDVLYPIVGMLGFSSAFSLPFFGLALFPRAVSKLPKSGGWLSTVKAFMGFVELIAAIKFFSTVDLAWQLGWLTKEVYLTLWFGIMLLAGLFLLGWIRIPTVHDGSKPGIPRIGAALASIAASVWFLTALNGNSLQDLEAFVPPDPYPYKAGAGATAKANEEGWLGSYDLAVAEAKKTGKPIFIDFTGIYCSNCRWMEKNVLSKQDVKDELKNFVLAKLYTDRRDNADDQRYQKLKIDLTGNAANPVYAVVNADGKLLASSEYDRDVQRFASFMKSGRDKLVSLR